MAPEPGGQLRSYQRKTFNTPNISDDCSVVLKLRKSIYLNSRDFLLLKFTKKNLRVKNHFKYLTYIIRHITQKFSKLHN